MVKSDNSSFIYSFQLCNSDPFWLDLPDLDPSISPTMEISKLKGLHINTKTKIKKLGMDAV